MARILYLTPGCFDKGGISRYSRYQIAAFRDIVGVRNVCAFSLRGPTPDSFEEPFSVEWFGSGVSSRSKAQFLAKAMACALSFRPDVIVTAHVNMSAAACLLGLAVGATTVLNCYGLEIWSGLRRDARLGLQATGHVIADCHFTARYLREHGLRPAEPISVIWDCVDLHRFTPGAPRPEVLARYGIPDPGAGFNILTLGRLTWSAAHKGYFRLLEVFAKVAAEAPQARLIIAGQGDLRDKLAARAAALGVGERVYLTGGVHEADLVDVYRSAHVFSLVSERGLYRGEGIPLTPLESAASGVPIVVGNQDGSQEAVEDGQTGFLVGPHDLELHAARLRWLVDHPEERARMGRAARVSCEERFSYPRFVEEHRRLLGDGLGSLRTPAHAGGRDLNEMPPSST